MHNFINDALFFLMWLACAQGKDCPNKCVVEWCPTSRYPDFNSYIDLAAKDPDEPESCAKVWCPAVKYTKYNRWLCGAPSDPELMPQETEEVELPNEEPETPQVEDTPTTEKEDKPTDNEETKTVTQRPFQAPPMVYNSDCWKDKRMVKNGSPCMLYPRRTEHVDGRGCYLGVCIKGRCMFQAHSICSAS
ncbi:uncharacterized protein [Dermacentor andersoni]|uniref:uncharacterized protein n=1 Tax=Dermacentor andersoni TaxID=34620 RepID=UPI003B39FDF1